MKKMYKRAVLGQSLELKNVGGLVGKEGEGVPRSGGDGGRD